MDQRERIYEEHGLPLQYALTDSADTRNAYAAAGVGVVVVVALALVTVFFAGDAPLWVFILLGLGAAAVAVVVYRNMRVWVGWGNPQLFLPSSDPLSLGDHVVVRFRRVAKRGVGLDGLSVTAALQVDEVTSTHSAGIHSSAAGQAQVVRVYEADTPVVLLDVVGQTVEADFAIDIPMSDVPPSLELLANEIRWRLVVSIAAPDAPDDDSTFPLVVAPIVADRLQSGGTGR